MVDFHGWLLPVQYEGILAEHRHCRRAACLFDTSHMGQIMIKAGDPAAINKVTTQDATSLRPGRARYGLLLNEAGGIIDDTILMRLDEREFLLVVNAATAEGDFRWVSGHLAGPAEVVNQSAAGWAKIDLQGPAAAKVLAPLTDADLKELKYFGVTRTKVCGRPCILSRTGYTGELGYEIFAPGQGVTSIFEELLDDERVAPAGLGARDSLRLEMCYALHGRDIGPDTNPVEADLEFFLKGEHDYIGAEALRRIQSEGTSRRLAAFAADSRRRAEGGNDILHDGKAVGKVTSAAFSPSLNVSIGMGYVPPDLAQPGTKLTVRTARAEIPVTVEAKPIYTQGTCRTKDIY